MKKEEYYAELTVNGLPDMKSVTYCRFVNWLEKQLKEFKKADNVYTTDKKIYAKTYRARLMK